MLGRVPLWPRIQVKGNIYPSFKHTPTRDSFPRTHFTALVQQGSDSGPHFFHQVVRRLLNEGQTALRGVNHPKLVNQDHALGLGAGTHQTDLQTCVACTHAALRNGANANHAQPVQVCMRHHYAGPTALLLPAQSGVESGDYDVAALPNFAAQRETSWPTAGIWSQSWSITNGSSPCMASSSCKL